MKKSAKREPPLKSVEVPPALRRLQPVPAGLRRLHEQMRVEGKRFAALKAQRPPKVEVKAKRHTGGRPPDYDWKGAAAYVSREVEDKGPLPRHDNGQPVVTRAVGLMADWFNKYDAGVPRPRSIRRWIAHHPQKWW